MRALLAGTIGHVGWAMRGLSSRSYRALRQLTESCKTLNYVVKYCIQTGFRHPCLHTPLCPPCPGRGGAGGPSCPHLCWGGRARHGYSLLPLISARLMSAWVPASPHLAASSSLSLSTPKIIRLGSVAFRQAERRTRSAASSKPRRQQRGGSSSSAGKNNNKLIKKNKNN